MNDSRLGANSPRRADQLKDGQAANREPSTDTGRNYTGTAISSTKDPITQLMDDTEPLMSTNIETRSKAATKRPRKQSPTNSKPFKGEVINKKEKITELIDTQSEDAFSAEEDFFSEYEDDTTERPPPSRKDLAAYLRQELEEEITTIIIQPFEETISFKAYSNKTITKEINKYNIDRYVILNLNNGGIAVTVTSNDDAEMLLHISNFCKQDVWTFSAHSEEPICPTTSHLTTITEKTSQSASLIKHTTVTRDQQCQTNSTYTILPVYPHPLNVLYPLEEITAAPPPLTQNMDSSSCNKRKGDSQNLDKIKKKANETEQQPPNIEPRPNITIMESNMNTDAVDQVTHASCEIILQPTEKGKNIRTMNNYKIMQDITSAVGNLEKITQMQYLKRGGLLLQTQDSDTITKLQAMTSIAGIPIHNTPANTKLKVKGVLRDIHEDISEKEIFDHLTSLGHNILLVKKMENAMGKRTLAVLTFLGSILPDSIKFFGVNHNLTTYVENPMQCGKCWRYAHASSTCRSKQRCLHCAQEGHEHHTCPIYKTGKPPTCCNCGAQHTALKFACPARKVCIEVLKHRAKFHTTYKEAKDLLFPRGSNYITALQKLTTANAKPLPNPGATSRPSCGQVHYSNNQELPKQYNPSNIPVLHTHPENRKKTYAEAVNNNQQQNPDFRQSKKTRRPNKKKKESQQQPRPDETTNASNTEKLLLNMYELLSNHFLTRENAQPTSEATKTQKNPRTYYPTR